MIWSLPYYILFWPKFFALWGLGMVGSFVLVLLGMSNNGGDNPIDGKRKRIANTLIWYFVRYGFFIVGNMEIIKKKPQIDYQEYLGEDW